jgi:hypothetical protein
LTEMQTCSSWMHHDIDKEVFVNTCFGIFCVLTSGLILYHPLLSKKRGFRKGFWAAEKGD